MLITGTIISPQVPTPPDQNGLSYQNVGIQDNTGQQYWGKIGFKKGNGYAQGQPIQATADLNRDGQTYYFKKYNPDPKYANQNQQAGRPVQPQTGNNMLPVQNQPPVYVPVQPTKERDFDREAHGKCFTLLMAAVLQSCKDPLFVSCDGQTKTAIADLATDCMNSYEFRTQLSREAMDDFPV